MAGERKAMPEFAPGYRFGERYRIVAPIGRGGMGRVYLAEDLRLNGKLRALKLTAAQADERDAFIREAELLSALQHPLLPAIVDYFPPDREGWAAIVMDYVAGDTLAERFARNGNILPYRQVFRYLVHLCEVLCYLHGQHPAIVFRDLKPANVLIDGHDRAILVDFGIARTYQPGAEADTEKLGTPAFAAPEQWLGRQTDGRSDVYGWGALAFYLLSGGRFARQYAGRHRRYLRDDVPGAFRDLLEMTLSDDPLDRPQSAHALARQLRRLADRGLGDTTSWPTGAREDDAAFVEIGAAANHSWRGSTVPFRMMPDAAHFPSDDGVRVAVVLSAYPGAGATLATLGLSRYLASRGVHHAVVECPGGPAELYALLNGDRHMPSHAVYADPAGESPVMPVWRNGTAAYYPLDPQTEFVRPDPAFGGWLRRLGVPLVLLDVSSKWLAPEMAAWLAEIGAGSFWWVADCLPAKWTAQRQRAAAALRQAAGRAATGWVANRDHAFRQRREWLQLFPQPPVARLPWLPAASIVQAVWQGQGYPDDASSAASAASACNAAFAVWARSILGGRWKSDIFQQCNNRDTI